MSPKSGQWRTQASSVRGLVRPTLSRGEPTTICSLGAPIPTFLALVPGHSPSCPATGPTVTSEEIEKQATHPHATPHALRKNRDLWPPTSTTARAAAPGAPAPPLQTAVGQAHSAGKWSDCRNGRPCPLDVAGAAATNKSGWARKDYFVWNDEIVKDTEKDSEKCNQQPAVMLNI